MFSDVLHSVELLLLLSDRSAPGASGTNPPGCCSSAQAAFQQPPHPSTIRAMAAAAIHLFSTFATLLFSMFCLSLSFSLGTWGTRSGREGRHNSTECVLWGQIRLASVQMTGWTSVNENIRVLTRNIRILLPPSSPAPAPAWHFSSTPTCPPPLLLLCKLCIQEAGDGVSPTWTRSIKTSSKFGANT